MRIVPTFLEEGVLFYCREAPTLSVAEWSREDLVGATDKPFGISSLDMLISEDKAEVRSDGIFVANPQVADLESFQLTQLGLPQPSPYQFRLHPKRLITTPDFNITYQFIGDNGEVAKSVSRAGAICQIEGKQYTLQNPIFSIIELIDNFDPSVVSTDDRLLFWGKILALIPSSDMSDMVEGSLGTYTINLVNNFTINIIYSQDKIILEPYLLADPVENQFTGDLINDKFILTQQNNDEFISFFKNFDLRNTYGFSRKNFVVLSYILHKTLDFVKKIQKRPSSDIKEFLNNPGDFIKEYLGDFIDRDALDKVFVETPLFLSSRIKGYKRWEPQGNFFWTSSGQDWLDTGENLPTDAISFYAEGRLICLPLYLIPKVIESLTETIKKRSGFIKVNDQTIPVNQEVLDFLINVSALWPEASDTPPPTGNKIVLDVSGNIETVEVFQPTPLDYRREVWDGEISLTQGFTLHAHQQVGINWLKEHWRSSTPVGCLLADDMGLGKTIQALYFMVWLKKQIENNKFEKRPMLVVAPTGLLANWEEESNHFFPNKELGILYNAYGSYFSSLIKNNIKLAINLFYNTDWILTTYETLRDKIKFFIKIDFSLVIFDEAQKIKNPSSLVTEMAKALKSEMTVAMTGTPVENSVRDIWCIIDAVKPGILDSCKNFMGTYGPDDNGYYNPVALKELNEKLCLGKPATMLRRNKEEHWLERPKKIIKIYEDVMPEKQANAYTNLLLQAKRTQKLEKRNVIFELIQKLRKISLHCPLDENTDIYKLPDISARIARTLVILDELARNSSKCLIFIEYLDTQAALADIIAKRYNLAIVPVINGQVTGENRLKIVNKFQKIPTDKFAVLIVATKSGGVGLNMTAATHVIHLSRWWNPAVEDQCSDRAYRIGQKSDVTIHYPLAIHPQYGAQSFDIKLDKVLKNKRELSKNVLIPSSISDKEIIDIFNEVVNV